MKRTRSDPLGTALQISLGLLLLLTAAPILFVFVYAFSSVSFAVFPPPGFSLRWFAALFHQPDLLRAAGHSLAVALSATLGSLVAGTLAALALVRYPFRGREVVRAAFLSPLIVPRIAFGIGILVYAVILRRFGGLDSLIAAHLVLTLPFVVSVMSASLVGAERVLEEAAMDLGATPLATFFRITVPQIKTGLAVSGFFAFLISWDQVEASLFLVKTQNMTLPVAMFYYLQDHQDPVIAALSTFLIAIAVAVAAVFVVLLPPRDLQRLLGGARVQGRV